MQEIGVSLGTLTDQAAQLQAGGATVSAVAKRSGGVLQLCGLLAFGDEPKVGAARTYASHNKNDGSNFDYNQYMGRDTDNSYIMANSTPAMAFLPPWARRRSICRQSCRGCSRGCRYGYCATKRPS